MLLRAPWYYVENGGRLIETVSNFSYWSVAVGGEGRGSAFFAGERKRDKIFSIGQGKDGEKG